MIGMDFDQIAKAISPEQLAQAIGAEKKDKGFRCPGTGHENGDRNPSLSISRKEGRTVACCHACGLSGSPVQVAALLWSLPNNEAAERLAQLVGISTADTSSGLGEIVDTYEYVDEQGDHLFEVVRFEPKNFRQRVRQGPGWSWKLDGVRRVLYNLPAVVGAVEAGCVVMLCEGEKDADNVSALGFVATTNAGGSGKWRDTYSEILRNARTCILPDNDEPGREHGRTVAQKLHGIAAEVRVLELPGLPNKGDVSDWIDAGGTAEELKKLVLAAPLWKPDMVRAPLPEPEESPLSNEHPTDLGNAQRFVRPHGDKVRYVHAWGAWLVGEGKRWATYRPGQVERRANATAKAIPDHTDSTIVQGD